ncbi:hypothetical protein MW887_008122 [Aspergillus wentii]|nr:hypothetical protein MW887_008122 [Aspergillus wentii]
MDGTAAGLISEAFAECCKPSELRTTKSNSAIMAIQMQDSSQSLPGLATPHFRLEYYAQGMGYDGKRIVIDGKNKDNHV